MTTPNAPAGERQPTVYDEAHPLAGVPMYADERRYVATLEAALAAARREGERVRTMLISVIHDERCRLPQDVRRALSDAIGALAAAPEEKND